MTATKLDFNIRKDKSHSKNVVTERKRETEREEGWMDRSLRCRINRLGWPDKGDEFRLTPRFPAQVTWKMMVPLIKIGGLGRETDVGLIDGKEWISFQTHRTLRYSWHNHIKISSRQLDTHFWKAVKGFSGGLPFIIILYLQLYFTWQCTWNIKFLQI